MYGTRIRTPSSPKITDGTLASRRMTGSRIVRIHSGANSTTNTDRKSAAKKLIRTAPVVTRNVPQMIGQAWKV